MPFHVLAIAIIHQKYFPFWKYCIGSSIRCSFKQIAFITPSCDKSVINIFATTTHEIKYGKYDTVCTTRLNLLILISLRASAIIIGAGIENIIVKRLVASVFLITL